MADWLKETNNEKYWKSLIQCLLNSTEELPTHQLTKDGTKLPPHHPCLLHAQHRNENVNDGNDCHGEKDKTIRLIQIPRHHQDHHLNVDSKNHHHLLHHDEQNRLKKSLDCGECWKI